MSLIPKVELADGSAVAAVVYLTKVSEEERREEWGAYRRRRLVTGSRFVARLAAAMTNDRHSWPFHVLSF